MGRLNGAQGRAKHKRSQSHNEMIHVGSVHNFSIDVHIWASFTRHLGKQDSTVVYSAIVFQTDGRLPGTLSHFVRYSDILSCKMVHKDTSCRWAFFPVILHQVFVCEQQQDFRFGFLCLHGQEELSTAEVAEHAQQRGLFE